MANRNFLVVKGEVYNVDTDEMGRAFHLGNCQVCRGKMGEGLRAFLWNYDLAPLRKQLKKMDWTLVYSVKEAQRRAALDKTELFEVLEHKARDKSPKRKK